MKCDGREALSGKPVGDGVTVLFPGIELAARIERSEARLVAANGEAVSRYREARGDAAAVFLRAIGGGVALHSGPASPMT